MGYSYEAVKIFMPAGAGKPVYADYIEHVPTADTAAQIFWLKNRRPDEWRDKQQVERAGKDGGPLQILVDRPPNETRDEWIERRKRELEKAR